VPENCVVAVDIKAQADISSRHQLITTSGAILNLQEQEVSDEAGVGTMEKFANENHWNLISTWQGT